MTAYQLFSAPTPTRRAASVWGGFSNSLPVPPPSPRIVMAGAEEGDSLGRVRSLWAVTFQALASKHALVHTCSCPSLRSRND
jgi:hypothetical protein